MLTTQSVLPPQPRPVDTQLLAVENLLLRLRRIDAGIMSCSAAIRSYSVSSGEREKTEEVSDSVVAR